MEHDKQQRGHIRVRRSLYLSTANTRACDAVITCEHLTHTHRAGCTTTPVQTCQRCADGPAPAAHDGAREDPRTTCSSTRRALEDALARGGGAQQ